jgi:hypothetical protein
MARTGLTAILATLRQMTNAGMDDYSIGITTYWSDDQLTVILDRHRAELNNAPCSPVVRLVNGQAQYFDYYIGAGNIEGGTALIVEDQAWNPYSSTLYTVDYARGIISFATNNLGLPVAVTGHSFDLNGAAADVWRQKAANVAQAYDFSTDNHRMSRSQMMSMALEMAALYEGMAPPTNHKIDRDDTTRGWGGVNYDTDER